MDSKTADKMPQLPDGIGLNHDDVARLLAEKSKTIVSPDDPLLMIVTLLNAFLAEENKLIKRHNAALAKVLGESADEYTKTLQNVSDNLGKTLSSKTVDVMRQVFINHEKTLLQHRICLYWTTAIMTISALVNVAVFIFEK